MKNINIGITINIKSGGENIWLNGITQNVINFYLLLKESNNNYNVFLLNTSDIKDIEYKFNNIEINQIEEHINDIDVLFILGSQITNEHYKILKKNNSKLCRIK